MPLNPAKAQLHNHLNNLSLPEPWPHTLHKLSTIEDIATHPRIQNAPRGLFRPRRPFFDVRFVHHSKFNERVFRLDYLEAGFADRVKVDGLLEQKLGADSVQPNVLDGTSLNHEFFDELGISVSYICFFHLEFPFLFHCLLQVFGVQVFPFLYHCLLQVFGVQVIVFDQIMFSFPSNVSFHKYFIKGNLNFILYFQVFQFSDLLVFTVDHFLQNLQLVFNPLYLHLKIDDHLFVNIH